MSLLVVALAVFAALAHMCAGPLHVHAGAVTAHEDRHSEHDHGDTAHGGSCEALKSATIMPVPAASSCLAATVLADTAGRSAPVFDSAPLATPSPPLFLLHAALLI